MSDLEATLSGLLDREAIRDLPLRYCDCVWRHDVAGIVDLFAPDGAFIVAGADGEISARGRDALLEFYAKGLDLSPRPYIHNHVIEQRSAERATGRCYLDLRSAKNDMEWLGAGYYADEYVKLAGEWKFASRHFTALRMIEGPGSGAGK